MVLQRLFFNAAVAAALLIPTQVSAQQTNTQRDAIVGGAAGAIIGGIVGNQNDETPEGIAIGGALGAIAGGLMGKSKDNELQRQWQYQQQAQQYQQQVAQQQQYALQKAVDVNDIVSMARSGVGDQLMVNHIQSNGVAQEIGVNEIITMHQNGVSEFVINTMQQTANGGLAQPQIQTAPQTLPTYTYNEPIREVVPVPVPVPVQIYNPRPIVIGGYRPPPRPHGHHGHYYGRGHGGPRVGGNAGVTIQYRR
jgi:outer membrane lipoprotein SlyB